MPNMGVVFLYGEITMKCKSCIWANYVNEQVIHCSFYGRCVKEDGWIADKRRGCGANDNRAHTKTTYTTPHVDREGMDKGLSMRGKDKLPEQDMSVLP